jgi:hypothetical protein
MSASHEAQAEIEKIARLLRVEPGRLAYLEEVDQDALRELRDQATDRMFAAGQHLFSRLGAASRIVPSPVAATISQRAFGPLLTSRMAGNADPAAAIAVAKRLPPDFLADVAVEMDPRRAPDVIAGLPAELVASTTAELAARGEWVTMGRFVGQLSEDVLAATVEVLDDEALLRIAFVTEQPARLADVLEKLPEQRLDGMVAAAYEHDLMSETDWLLDVIGPQGAQRIKAAIARRQA